LGAECKEKSILLYKVFKMFFSEQERKWSNLTLKIKQKLEYYKDLCKTVLQNKDKKENILEKLNEILFQNNLTEKNLQKHKSIIYNFIELINEKRDEIYLSKSEIDISKRELNLFVHGFDLIKLDKDIREKIREIDWKELYNNISKELSHKQ
jgi:hypothetical protein